MSEGKESASLTDTNPTMRFNERRQFEMNSGKHNESQIKRGKVRVRGIVNDETWQKRKSKTEDPRANSQHLSRACSYRRGGMCG